MKFKGRCSVLEEKLVRDWSTDMGVSLKRGRDLAVRNGSLSRNCCKTGSGSLGTALGSRWVESSGIFVVHLMSIYLVPTTVWTVTHRILQQLCEAILLFFVQMRKVQFREVLVPTTESMARALTKSLLFIIPNCFHLLSIQTIMCLSRPYDKHFKGIIA